MKNGWTTELIEKFSEYVRRAMCYRVTLAGSRVYTVSTPYYYEDDTVFTLIGSHEVFNLENYKPEDFKVIRIEKIEKWWNENKIETEKNQHADNGDKNNTCAF